MAMQRSCPRLSSLFVISMSVALLAAAISSEAVSARGNDGDSIMRCSGTSGQCAVADDEFGLGSEANTVRPRRVLTGDAPAPAPAGDSTTNSYAYTSYLSYLALEADSVPCSVPGASYYNCLPGAAVNPYTRGCLSYTGCRN